MHSRRFYKWYYWLFPMLTLVALDRLCGDEGRKRRWYLAAGLIAGIGFLYRHDLGLACLGTAALTLVMEVRLARRDRKSWVKLAWAAAGFLFPLACWFLALTVVGGPISCRWYLSALLAGTSGVVEHWRLPWPRWNWHAPASEESCRVLLLAMMGLSYGFAILVGQET